MKKLIINVLLCILPLITIAQTNQQTVVLDILPVSGQTIMINHEGKIIKTFSAMERCKIEDSKRHQFTVFSLEKSFALYDFSQGYLPVVKEDKWAFYDSTGKEVKDLQDKYYLITAPVDGVYRAFEMVEGKKHRLKIVYLNQHFEELFNGQRFDKATNMKNGYGFAQLDNPNKSWVLLSLKNNSIAPLDSTLSASIYDITKNEHGYGTIRYKSGAKKDLLNEYGEVVNMPSITGATLRENEEIIVENIKNCIDNHSYALSKGLGISPPIYMKEYKSQNKQLEWGLIFNHEFTPRWMKLPKNEFLFCEVASDQYFGGLLVDTLSKQQKYTYYDYSTKTKLFSADEQVEYIINGRFYVTTTSPGYSSSLIKILDNKGNIIYSLPNTDRLFCGLSTVPQSNFEDVHLLSLSDNEDLSNLKQCKNLRHIEFNAFNFTQLPEELSTFKHLESIKLTNCKHIEELPTWLSSSHSLKTLSVIKCDQMNNLEMIIENTPNLKSVKTTNYRFQRDFIKRMQQLKPDLKFDVDFRRSTNW